MSSNAKLTPKLRFPEFRKQPGWDRSTIGEVATILKGKGLSKADLDPLGKRFCIRYAELYTRYGEVIDNVYSRTNAPDDDLFLSDSNDVIIPASGETKADIATASCVLRAGVALGSDLNVLRTPHDGVFLSYYINGRLRSVIAKVAQGDTVVHLYPSQLRETALAVPSPAEQQKIADCLSSLDELIAAEGRKWESLRAYKKGLMQQLFPRDGETTPRLRFPEFRGKAEWTPHKFGEFVVKSFYGTSASTSETGLYPVLRMGNMADGGLDFTNLVYIDLDDEGFESFRLQRGDILLNRTNSRELVGKISIFDRDSECITASYIVSFRLDEQRIDPWFCNLMLNTQMYQSRIKLLATPSISQANINPTTFRTGLDIAIPKLAEQQRIAECLSSLDAQIAAQFKRIAALRAHKKGLMQQLFPTGEASA